ncbi:MAG: DUF2752 domain-containing protein [Chitinophagaceae bacterium]|nr:DUF2752 domain-containing protein [Chitinophagaceae bacterium]
MFLAILHIIQWLEGHMFTCPSVKYLHIICPGCGMQRSGIALLKGNIAESFRLYPALLPMLVLCAFTMLHWYAKFSNGGKIIIALQTTVVTIITVHYIYKILNHQIFL